MRLQSLIPLLSLCATVWCLHESDVGVVDWHKRLIGVPLSSNPVTAPSFYRTGNQSIILTTTASNVLAALEPENGALLWRYIFDPVDRIVGYFKGETVVATLSAPGGANLRTFDATTGELILEKNLHALNEGAMSEPAYYGKDVVFAGDDLYVLTNGCTVRHINGTTGEEIWTYTAEDRASLVITSKLILTDGALYTVGVAKSISSYTLHITTLSPTTGEVIKKSNIVSSIVDPLTQLITFSKPDKPIALWLEQGTLRHLSLTPELNAKPRMLNGGGFSKILDVGLSHLGQAVIARQDGSSLVIKIDPETGYPKSVWDYKDAADKKEFADSMYAGGIDALGNSYVTRVCWSHKMEKGYSDVFAGHLVEGQGLASSYYFPFETNSSGIIGHIALDSENPSGWNLQTRLLVTTTTGSVQLWEQSDLKWAREESLALIAVTELVEIPGEVASETKYDLAEGFVPRLMRHLADVQGLPNYLVNFGKRFITGSYATASTSAAPKSANASEGLFRDTFGFRQVIVSATASGKLFGIDSSNGEIIWSRLLGMGWADNIGGTIHPVKLFTLKTVSDGGDPEVVLIGQRRAENGLIDTVLFHVNALTGSDITGESPDGDVLAGRDLIGGPLIESYLLKTKERIIILLDEYLQVYIYPDTPETRGIYNEVVKNVSFPIRSAIEGRHRILGHKIADSVDGHRPLAYATWSLTLPDGEEVQTLIPQASQGPVASVGKVLGNRSTLYKYLDPRLFTALTVSASRGMCGIYVVDAAKGTVIYHAEVKATIKGCDIKSTLVENWLVYHYYEGEVAGGTAGGTMGYRMISVEFYEGKKADEKIESSNLTPYSSKSLEFQTFEKAYIFPYAITAIAPTSTKYGITSKDIIVATTNHRIQSFPRRALDPRRPSRKITAEEAEEMLSPYDPLLPNDPRRVLSHNYEVANVQRIITAPALLESTSLVFAYGLDMFLTRVAPSNTFDVLSENFNKAQLVVTITCLLIAILVTRPMVQRKKLREKWFN